MKKHGLDIRTLCGYFFSMGLIMMCFQLGKVVIEETVGDTFAAAYYFEYNTIETTESEYKAGNIGLTVKSFVKWNKSGLPVVYVDKLYCNFEDGYGLHFVSSQINYDTSEKVDHTSAPKIWKLNIQLPTENATCQIQSSIAVDVKGENKIQFINSNSFSVVKR